MAEDLRVETPDSQTSLTVYDVDEPDRDVQQIGVLYQGKPVGLVSAVDMGQEGWQISYVATVDPSFTANSMCVGLGYMAQRLASRHANDARRIFAWAPFDEKGLAETPYYGAGFRRIRKLGSRVLMQYCPPSLGYVSTKTND